ncbi:hypothetical protein RUM43_004982 [Polyplax serrata]|uniref:Uncharacterized protein n=1 Tax=Polyplax serrata TaxID=468196 RepID=A0AAN8SDQ2_POLSC
MVACMAFNPEKWNLKITLNNICLNVESRIVKENEVNPLFNEDHCEDELNGNSNGTLDQRLSPRKSISSGYESRCNSSSDSSSCTECDEGKVKKPVVPVKREKRLTKLSKSDKKKRGEHAEKKDTGQEQKVVEETLRNSSSSPKRKPARVKNVPGTGSSVLSPIPEGKIDCSIPPPIWPRYEEGNMEKREIDKLREAELPGRIFHNGTTNPVNFMFKYNERYPKSRGFDGNRILFNYLDKKANSRSIKSEYEQNWVECCLNQCGESNKSFVHDKEDGGKSLDDSGKGHTPDSTLERLSIDRNEMTQEVLRDLAGLIAYAMSRKNSPSLESILKNLAESIQKSLEVLSQTETEDNFKILCDNLNHNKYLSKLLTALVTTPHQVQRPSEDGKNVGVDTNELSLKLQKLSKTKGRNSPDELSPYRLDNLKEDVYSSGSEGKNSSSSSSGCKDLYMSSNSSTSAGKDNVFIPSSFESIRDRDKVFRKSEKSSDEEPESKGSGDEVNRSGDNRLTLIHHQREFSSSSAESAFGSSDSSPPASDSSSGNGVLNPVFLHENIYSVPKSMRNAIICDSFSRTKNADCGSVRNCGSSAFEKLISAKRKTSHDSQMEDLGPLTYADEGKTRLSTVVATAKVDNTVLKKVEHPYYVSTLILCTVASIPNYLRSHPCLQLLLSLQWTPPCHCDVNLHLLL